MKRLYLVVLSLICVLAAFPGSAQAASANPSVKEINFVYLHGYTGTAADMQLLDDNV